MPRLGRAHTLGLSTAEFEVAPDGHVEGRLTFAAAEAPRKDLARFVIDGVEVDADGTACEATFGGADDDAIDGLVLRATYACPVGAETIDVTLYYLSALPAGHRAVAALSAGPLVAQALLTGDRRYVELKLPARRHGVRSGRIVAIAGVVALAGLAAFFLGRRRVTS